LKVFFPAFSDAYFWFLGFNCLVCDLRNFFFSFVVVVVCRVRRMAPLRRLRRHLCITARMERAEVLFTVVDRPVWLATVLLDHLILTTIIIQQRLRWLTVTTCRRRPRLLIPPKVSTYTHNFFFFHSELSLTPPWWLRILPGNVATLYVMNTAGSTMSARNFISFPPFLFFPFRCPLIQADKRHTKRERERGVSLLFLSLFPWYFRDCDVARWALLLYYS
jgi:hypothetical protein